MHSARLAELILSLTTSSERAAAITGDLLEQRLGRGEFWVSVLRTAFAQVGRQASAGMLVRGLLQEFGLTVAACGLFLFVLLVAISVATVWFHSDIPEWLDGDLAFALAYLFVPYKVGAWMARRYPGRELAGTLTLALLHAATNICAAAICAGFHVQVDASFSQIHFVDWSGDLPAMLKTIALYLTLYPAMLAVGAATSRSIPILHAPSAPASSDE